ncbi:hypothetical protein DAETH_21810 [Deinococcus aetherius]|uniref:Uncharacterized protein n=1 Tax=Deinococcus aetherius TaxID=200252 RepID=A0ABN6RFU3_9DEIO|nr:hypothetical protein DAETH_21810 [Deinococcus aetherius]
MKVAATVPAKMMTVAGTAGTKVPTMPTIHASRKTRKARLIRDQGTGWAGAGFRRIAVSSRLRSEVRRNLDQPFVKTTSQTVFGLA